MPDTLCAGHFDGCMIGMSLQFYTKCIVALAVTINDELAILKDFFAVSFCRLGRHLMNGIRLNTGEFHLVDVAIGTCDGETEYLLTCRKFLEEVTRDRLVGAPIVVGRLWN